ncbi:hypothetical protein Barb6_03405 [Bacteroidales bacterium Barb6]|nr:hypothetical protein Barb6_03405 [Bacteroidales bacterium Barb6]
MICICIILSGFHWGVLSVTPHSAALHVGLKSAVLAGLPCGALSGHLRNMSYQLKKQLQIL